jgi:hypothetical protein
MVGAILDGESPRLRFPGWIEGLTATDPVYVLPALLVVTILLQRAGNRRWPTAAAEVPAVRHAADVRRDWRFGSLR